MFFLILDLLQQNTNKFNDNFMPHFQQGVWILTFYDLNVLTSEAPSLRISLMDSKNLLKTSNSFFCLCCSNGFEFCFQCLYLFSVKLKERRRKSHCCMYIILPKIALLYIVLHKIESIFRKKLVLKSHQKLITFFL